MNDHVNKKYPAISKLKDTQAVETLVMEWFERENKPVTPQSLTDALGSRVAKSIVQKVLEDLHTKGKLCVKELKKARYFYLTIDCIPSSTGTVGDPAALEESVAQEAARLADSPDTTAISAKSALADAIELTMRHIQGAQRTLQQLRQRPTAEAREAHYEELRTEASTWEEKVHTASKCARADGEPESAGRILAVQHLGRAYQRSRLLWKERRGYAQRLMDAAFGDSCSEADLVDRFGIITDAAAGVSFVASAVLLPPAVQKILQ